MKRKLFILGLFLVLIVPSNIYAISGSASCQGPGTVELGETFTVTIYGSASEAAYWQSSFVNSSGNLRSNSGTGEVFTDSASSSFSKSYSFTAINTGTATVSQYFSIGGEDGSEETVSSSTCSINIVEATRPNGDNYSSNYDDSDETDDEEVENKSSNSYLKSLNIDGTKINPTFNKDKLDYTVVVNGDIEKINIKAELEDEKATIEGLGEKELKEGINKFEIIVTAENKEVRKYTITVTRKEKNPIEVTINKKKYTVLKNDIGLKVPEGFVKTSVIIEKEEVLAYSNKFTGYLIVALVDEEGNASWYIYNQKNATYTKYTEFNSSGVRLIILEPKKKDIPHRYKKISFDLNGEKVDGYALEFTSPYRLVYALNMATGEKDFYLYDIEQNTFQRFYNKQVEIYRGLLKKLEIGIIGLISIIGIMLIIILSQIAINKKTKKFIKSGGKKEKDDLNVLVKEEEKHDKEEEKLEKTKALEKIDKTSRIKPVVKEKELSKSDLKRLKKEEEKRLKKERREFFK